MPIKGPERKRYIFFWERRGEGEKRLNFHLVDAPHRGVPASSLSPAMILVDTYVHVGASPEKSTDVARASDTRMVYRKNEELEKIGAWKKASTKTDPIVYGPTLINPRQENLSDMNITSMATKKERKLEVDKVKEEMEQSPSDNVIPINHVLLSETHGEVSSSNGVKVLQKSPLVESGLESLDGSNAEIEGESNVDRLRRQNE
ncbi:hypothetical protein CR513_35519, partial [Mucuna pruriens]